MSRQDQDYIAKYAGNSIRYFPALSHALGSVTAGIALSQLIYWANMGHRHDRYIFKTVEELFYESGLTKNQQLTAVKVLRKFGLIDTKLAGTPAKRHFLVNEGNVARLLTTWRESLPIELHNALFKLSEKQTTITETTPKTTIETTPLDELSISSRKFDLGLTVADLSDII